MSLGIDLDIEQDVLQFGFLAYSSAVLFYHAMDYLWNKMGLANLSEPPKLRWAYGGANIWCSIVIQFMPDYPDADVISPAMFIFGLAIVWWATTEKKKKR